MQVDGRVELRLRGLLHELHRFCRGVGLRTVDLHREGLVALAALAPLALLLRAPRLRRLRLRLGGRFVCHVVSPFRPSWVCHASRPWSAPIPMVLLRYAEILA